MKKYIGKTQVTNVPVFPGCKVHSTTKTFNGLRRISFDSPVERGKVKENPVRVMLIERVMEMGEEIGRGRKKDRRKS